MALKDDLNALAIDLITQFGEPTTFNKVTPGTYDPVTQTQSTTMDVYSGYIVPSSFNKNEIDGAVVLSTDSKIYAHSMSEVPEVEDTLSVAGETLKIVHVKQTRINGLTVLYTLQCRK